MKTLIYIIGIFFLQTYCYQQEFHPESGDLIFQVGIAGGMTEAIADATGGESDLSFTHVGIITVEPAGCSDSPHNSSRTQGAGDPGDRRSQKVSGPTLRRLLSTP